MTTRSLDPFVEVLLKQMGEQGGPPPETLTPTQAREIFNPFLKELGGLPEAVAKVEDMSVPGPAGRIPIRVYTPDGRGPFPILVHFHTGGWIFGDVGMHDSIYRILANGANCIVVSVGYRLAPEHKFPTPLEDAYAATQWVANNASRINGDPARVAVGGDSAGGNMATVVCMLARDMGGPSFVFQLLTCPAMNLSSFDSDSYRNYGEGYLLTTALMEWVRGHYLEREEDAVNPNVSPLLADDLSGLPPALVLTAECDVLTSDAEAYANRLQQAGVPVQYKQYDGVIHLFFGMAGLDRAKNGIYEAIAGLRSAFAK